MRIYDLIQLARQYMLLGVIVVILLLTGYFLLYKLNLDCGVYL